MAGTLIVSLDFELFWGMQDCSTLEEYGDNILGGRKAIPRMLKLFEKYGIHATWATVGLLFAENKDEMISYSPEKDKLPAYEKKILSTYNCISKIGENEKEEPYYYGLSLINKIAKVKGQEIASHTYSHYYCREVGQTIEQFEVDMLSAKEIAKQKGYNLKSVVLPRNQCEPEYTEVLVKLGFLTYRDEENDWIHERVKIRPLMRILRLMDVYFPLTGYGGYIPKVENGIVNLVGSRMYKPFFKPLGLLEKLKVHRIKKQMLHAAKNGLTFHLWWHPHNVGVYTKYHLKQLEAIFSYYETLKHKYGMRSLNMQEAAEEFLKG